jgi:translation elongation factor EF-Tu-like GTPase
MVARDDSALFPQLRIEMADKLVTVQIEVQPLLIATTFHTTEHPLVEASRLSDISDLHAYVKWG